jgi:hypothetical protein
VKALVMVLALTLTAPALANERCEALADAIYTIATQRDAGASRREMRSRVIQNVDESVRDAFLAMVDLVFSKPHYDPDTESNLFYRECIQPTGTQTRLSF